jgi:hypothetical protein
MPMTMATSYIQRTLLLQTGQPSTSTSTQCVPPRNKQCLLFTHTHTCPANTHVLPHLLREQLDDVAKVPAAPESQHRVHARDTVHPDGVQQQLQQAQASNLPATQTCGRQGTG